jgi:hypothetical protein
MNTEKNNDEVTHNLYRFNLQPLQRELKKLKI